MKFGIQILPREVILDTQGRAVEQILLANKMQISHCRVGRYVEVEVPIKNEDEALKEVQKMTEFVLVNPLIEVYKVARLPEVNP
ncbi:MAG: phosphoribosylformylglycinamidine synthase subunit PurS [Bdellovibrionaceae bacterium]|nr:phosphoribosylformylglycinamidine synthase subunit PurS [Pseudobdellovibrionaceae bacterium]